MADYSFNTIRSYMDDKQFKGDELIQFGIMMILAILLIVGGVFILQDEDIFRKMYEGFTIIPKAEEAQKRQSPFDWNKNLPEDLTLDQLKKNLSLLRKKSQINIYTGYTMIATGSIISLYQIYNIFF